jgi:hypothetical protein
MKLLVYVLTAGNDILFETLDSIKENVKIPHQLCVFYHALDENHPISLDFFNHILTYTDDVIMATKNQKCPAVSGYGKIYQDYDLMLELPDDMILKPNSVETMLFPYQILRRVGYVGQGCRSYLMQYPYQIDSLDNFPDWGGILNHEMVNEIGGHCAFFPTYGSDATEWMQRVHLAHWKIVNYKDLFIHGGKNKIEHASRDELKDHNNIIGESFGRYKICEQLGFQHYNWWSNKI